MILSSICPDPVIPGDIGALRPSRAGRVIPFSGDQDRYRVAVRLAETLFLCH